MFRLRDISLGDGYTSGELANELMKHIVYTYGDRVEDAGYVFDTIPAEGAERTGWMYVGACMLCTRPDATMLVTEYASGKMGIIPFTQSERNFVEAHGDLMQDIAQLLGYTDYVVYSYVQVSEGEEARLAVGVKKFSYPNNTSITYNHAEASNLRFIYIPEGQPKAMFTTVNTPNIGNVVAPNGVTGWVSNNVTVPLEYYLTDIQNVQDAARSAVASNKALADGQVETLTTALANVASLLGGLSVFGNTVKDVADRYNSITQYIPRP